MVIAGGGNLTEDEIEFLNTNQIRTTTFHLSATDNQLNLLYKNAICFVFPSIYEGFGIPILEAFKNNCPILLSNSSCFPEIAGDAALYFEPDSIESLVTRIEQLLQDETLRNQLVNKGTGKTQKLYFRKMYDRYNQRI